jgi:hypothetical protein
MKKSPIHKAADKLSKALNECNISFAIVGALAANAHGHKRTTEDVDILVTHEGLAAFKSRWLGLGWVELFPGSKGMRDTENNVKIDILLTGDFPGDGKPKPIAFPRPDEVGVCDKAGIPILGLRHLIELKLASGMTASHRLRDLDDVMHLIRANNLSREYAQSLDPYVRDAYWSRWEAAQVNEDY